MDIRAKTATVWAGAGCLWLAGCAAGIGTASPPPVPPPSAEQDRTTDNNQQVTLFVSRDPGWQAWLAAMAKSGEADNALVGASRSNTPVIGVIQGIIMAQDAYRIATSFNLFPFTVKSSCLSLPSETEGSVRLTNGLTLRYGAITTETKRFADGASCVVAVGLIDEIDSSRGMTIAKLDDESPKVWGGNFSPYLIWRQPYWMISTATTLSVPDLVRLIEE